MSESTLTDEDKSFIESVMPGEEISPDLIEESI